MRKRRRYIGPVTLLSNDWTKVESKIIAKVRDEVAVFCPFILDRKELIQESVTEEVLDVLTKAHQYKTTYYDPSTGVIPFNDYVNFTVDYKSYGCLVPNEKHAGMSPAIRKQVQEWYDSFMPIYRKWMLVRHVAHWFNNTEGVTSAAVRYYWPAMMALLPPDSPKLREMHMAGVGTYQKEPKGISYILPLCRETASTVTAGQLLTETAEDKPELGVVLNAHSHTWCHTDYTGRGHNIETVEMQLQF